MSPSSQFVVRASAVLLALLAGALTGCGMPNTAAEYLARAQQSIAQRDFRAAAIDLKNALQREPDNVAARVALGQVTLELGDVAAATSELRLARRMGANDSNVLVLLARALLAGHEYQAVLKEVDAAQLTEPAARRELLALRGTALLALDRHADARAEFEAELALEPRAARPRIGLAAALMATDGFDAAKAALDEARRLEPRNASVVAALGRLYMENRQFVDAERTFQAAVELAQADPPPAGLLTALAGLADAQMALNKVDAAAATVGRLNKLASGSPGVLYLQARVAFLRGDYDAARGGLEQILAQDARNGPTQLLLGAVNYAQGNLGQADMYLSGVLAAEPGNSFARRLLADTRLRQQKPNDALSALQPALKAGDSSVLSLAGWAAVQAGDVDAGISYLEQGAKARPADADAQLQLAAGYIAAGHPADAVAILQRLPATEDTSYRRGLLLIAARARNSDPDGALQTAEQLARSRPNNATVLAVLARLYASRGNFDAARAQLMRAAELDSRNPGPQLNLGRLDLVQGKLADAERRFRQALALRPGHPSILVALAQVDLAGGRVEEAMRWLETARKQNLTAVEPRVVLGQLFLAQRQFDQAGALAQEAAKLAPDNAAALNLLGLTLGATGRMADSISTFENAAEHRPMSAAYRFNLARAYLLAGRPTEALAAARECIRLDPDYIPALALVGSLLAASNPAEARSMVARIRARSPQHPAAYVLDGDLQLAAKRYAEAADAYQAASRTDQTQTLALRELLARRLGRLPDQTAPLLRWLDRHPEDQRVRLALAQAEESLGRNDAATAAYEAVIATDPRNAIALNNLAWLYHRRSDPRALATARQAYDAAPRNGAIADTYGWLLVESGELKKGIEMLREAALAAPKVPEIKYHLAVGLARAGQGGEARRELSDLLGSAAAFGERAAAERLLRSLAGER